VILNMLEITGVENRGRWPKEVRGLHVGGSPTRVKPGQPQRSEKKKIRHFGVWAPLDGFSFSARGKGRKQRGGVLVVGLEHT